MPISPPESEEVKNLRSQSCEILRDFELTEFSLRHFEAKFGGTKILNYTPDEFVHKIKSKYSREYDEGIIKSQCPKVIEGYADFCKLVPIENFTDARAGVLPITLENYQYLRSGYSARRDGELPVMSRWLELPLGKPLANYLILVCYSKDQINAEAIEEFGWKSFKAEWGVVAILGQMVGYEEPMKPVTMMRNALGKSEGGSGVPVDPEKYQTAVDFWSEHATVK
jgi:hypothetical protein